MNDARTTEIATSLAEVRERIRVASVAARRTEPTLIVVTKTWPADDVRRLASLGVTDVGENRDQEAAPKFDATVDLALRWHMVGQLQRNKANHVARYADVVHALDRAEIVTALDRGAGLAQRRIVGLIQVSLDGAEGRGGAAPESVAAIADQIAKSEHLDLGGVMAVAPLGADPGHAFAELVRISDRLRSDYPGASMISAGMSEDLEQAVAAGATHLRVGSSILGMRSPAR